MEHALTCNNERAHFSWSSGMCTIEHHPRQILDVTTAMRVEQDRRELCPDHRGVVLHLVPSNIDMMDHDALRVWMGEECMTHVVARAVVVPSGITALKHRIRWMFFSSDIPFRVFRNPQVAKGWLQDCWLRHVDSSMAKEEAATEMTGAL
ncbi:MAG: hypothetical protein RLZZ314_241 [Bacteroidota bacterium]|jgi:hypothetical protein|nr:hypothetical protein [Bacteroidota bacterium]